MNWTKTVLGLAALLLAGLAGAALIVFAARATSVSSAPPAPRPVYRWACTEVPDGQTGWGFGLSPKVTITNISSRPIPVSVISVTVLSLGGSPVVSLTVGQIGWGTVWIPPGSSAVFTDDHGQADPSWIGACRVDHVA